MLLTASAMALSAFAGSTTAELPALNVAIDRHKIEMKDGIKALGTYPVQVRLGNNIIAKTSVQVVNQS